MLGGVGGGVVEVGEKSGGARRRLRAVGMAGRGAPLREVGGDVVVKGAVTGRRVLRGEDVVDVLRALLVRHAVEAAGCFGTTGPVSGKRHSHRLRRDSCALLSGA
ncbi:hypothetical protein QE406_001635 [Microbacterium testaceum]|nr:hypothetical protein [Microbacterium testaceum]